MENEIYLREPFQDHSIKYYQEYISQPVNEASDRWTISDELLDEEEHESSYASDNSQLSFEEIEKEYETNQATVQNHDRFDKHSVDLGIDPIQMVSARTNQHVETDPVYVSQNINTFEEEPVNQTSCSNIRKKQKRSVVTRSSKRAATINQTIDIEQQVHKRNEKLQRLKQNNSHAVYKATGKPKVIANDSERKYHKLLERNEYLKQENQKCKF